MLLKVAGKSKERQEKHFRFINNSTDVIKNKPKILYKNGQSLTRKPSTSIVETRSSEDLKGFVLKSKKTIFQNR